MTALLLSCEGKRELVSDINEHQANEILVLLAAKGISGEKQAKAVTGAGGGGGAAQMFSIIVPGSQEAEALAILNRNGLPRRKGPDLLTLFAKSGLVSSAQEEQIRYQEGLSSQIASTIRQIDGVLNAIVQISFPQEQAMLPGQEEQRQQITASVYVKHQGVLDDPNSQLITKIKRLVSSSVVGLTFDNVTVVSDRSRMTDVVLEEQADTLPGDEREYVRVWTLVVAKESASRFKTIALILCVIILLLAGFIGWLVWKMFPALQHAGGVQELFLHTRPLHFEGLPKKKKKKKSKEELSDEESFEFPSDEEEEEEEE
jgi:type III secretion protein J